MRRFSIVPLAALFFSSLSYAHNISVNKTLPDVSVTDYGQLILTDGKISYKKWSSQELIGKVHIIQAIAGRKKAKEMNEPMIDAIKAANFPKDKYQTTTIINQDDSIWGTGSFVKSSAHDSKKEFSWSSIVLDADGKVAISWDLTEQSSAIILTDSKGKVQFVKEGALKPDEIKQVINMVKDNIK